MMKHLYSQTSLTSRGRVPGRPVDGAILFGEVMRVTHPARRGRHQPVCGGIRERQPAEDQVVRSGRGPLQNSWDLSPVIREGHYQLASLKIAP